MSEIIILPVEQRIESALVKENITEKLIAEMKANFLPMKLKSLEDKEGYVEIVERRKEVKVFLSNGKKLFKNGREDAIAEQRAWVAKEKWFESEVRPILEHLEGEEQKYEAEEERKKAEKKRKQEANVINRGLQLTKMGATVVDDKLVLETAEVDMLLLREADDDTYTTIILPEFQVIFDRLEAARIEAERLENERLDKEAADRKAFEDAQVHTEKEEAEAKQKAIEEQERFDRANDSQKWVLFIDKYFAEIAFPEMKNKKYREFVNMAKDKIEEIKALK